MKKTVKILVLVVAIVAIIVGGVSAYYLTLPRVSLVLYPDSKVTGCKERLNETVILHVKNDGTVNLFVNACEIDQYGGSNETSVHIVYMFQNDIEIPVGIEALIIFPAAGGEVNVETVSAPSGTSATGGLYAVSDNPDANPLGMVGRSELWIHTRSGTIGGGESTGGIHLAVVP